MNLEDFVSENRGDFEVDAPANHAARFAKLRATSEGRLVDVPVGKASVFHIGHWLAAASVLLVLGLGVLLWQHEQGLVAQAALPTEYLEVEAYYKDKLSDKLLEFEAIKCKVNSETKASIVSDMEEIDANYEALRKEFAESPDKEIVLEAMINCFRAKEVFINQLIRQMHKNC